MAQGLLTVQPDGTLTVDPRAEGDTTALETALSGFTEPVRTTEGQRLYRLTAASIWRARRAGLSLNEILQILETHSTTALPDRVRADIALWSQQIDRLTLEADQGRLLLRSTNPLAITAVMRHHTLGAFVTRQLDATTAELRADAYPELVETFDACRYPVMDRVSVGEQPVEAPPPPAPRQTRPTVQPPPRPVKAGARHAELLEMLQWLPRQCQATTKAGRQCKNRARPNSMFCRVHADRSPPPLSPPTYAPNARLASRLLEGMLETGLVTLPQLAVYRVVTLMGIGLITWLLCLLLMRLGIGGLDLPLPSWAVAGLSLVITCGLLGRLVLGISLLTSLHLVLLIVSSVLLDCLHKEGLILNLCFVGLPVAIPVVMLSHYGLSLAWVFLCFPVGVVLGLLFYTFLDAMSD